MSESPGTNHSAGSPTRSFSPADRVADLNDIDQSVSALLTSASDAIGILSKPGDSSKSNVPPITLESVQTDFQNAASNYFSILSSIDVRLRRQVYALEEAGLISSGSEGDARQGRALGGDGIPRTGGGPLDTSWLNARANDKVEEAMRSELRDQMKDFVTWLRDQAKEENSGKTKQNLKQDRPADESMEIDTTD